MNKLNSLSLIVFLFIYTTSVAQVNKAYKNGFYADVVSSLEPKQDQLNLRQTLKLAHSYYETKNFFKSKILYYQVLQEKGLNDVHKLALADILLSTGMTDLTADMLNSCVDQTSKKHDILTEKLAWVIENKQMYSSGQMTKVEYEALQAGTDFSAYFNNVIDVVQVDRSKNGYKKSMKAAYTLENQSLDNVNSTIANNGVAYVRNTYFTNTNQNTYSVSSTNVNDFMKSNDVKFEKLKKRNENRLWIKDASASNTSEFLSFCNDASNYVSPYFFGDKLYFSSDRAGGFGGFDLYYVTREADGSWGAPVNLGAEINSAGNEMYPTFVDNKLCFSSDGLPGFGGADIFSTTVKNNTFTTPVNLGQGINSGYDDLTLVRENENKYFFVSNRDNLKGLDEVYKLEMRMDDLVVSK